MSSKWLPLLWALLLIAILAAGLLSGYQGKQTVESDDSVPQWAKNAIANGNGTLF